MTELKTKRLRIVPMTTEQLGVMTRQPTDAPHMDAARREMYDACLAHPADWLWYTNWQIHSRANGTCIGGLAFKGCPANGAVELGYGIEPPYQNQGYMTEVVKAAMNWAFSRPAVYFVMAETERENQASVRVLQKNDFKPAGEGLEGPRWAAEKPAVGWMSVYMSIGMGLGVSFGSLYNNLALGISLGLCLGIALGSGLDAQDRGKRKKYKRELNIPK